MIGLGIENFTVRNSIQICQVVGLRMSELTWEFSPLPKEPAGYRKDAYVSSYRQAGLFNTQCCQIS